jgi:hypothetical protein
MCSKRVANQNASTWKHSWAKDEGKFRTKIWRAELAGFAGGIADLRYLTTAKSRLQIAVVS